MRVPATIARTITHLLARASHIENLARAARTQADRTMLPGVERDDYIRAASRAEARARVYRANAHELAETVGANELPDTTNYS